MWRLQSPSSTLGCPSSPCACTGTPGIVPGRSGRPPPRSTWVCSFHNIFTGRVDNAGMHGTKGIIGSCTSSSVFRTDEPFLPSTCSRSHLSGATDDASSIWKVVVKVIPHNSFPLSALLSFNLSICKIAPSTFSTAVVSSPYLHTT